MVNITWLIVGAQKIVVPLFLEMPAALQIHVYIPRVRWRRFYHFLGEAPIGNTEVTGSVTELYS